MEEIIDLVTVTLMIVLFHTRHASTIRVAGRGAR